jgi:hypothetical protein
MNTININGIDYTPASEATPIPSGKAQRDALRDKHFAAHDLLTASQALVDRWDTPLWKDAMHTAIFIEVLRDAVQKYRAREV